MIASQTNRHSPLVTVIMPHRGCEAYLHQAVSSVLNQNFRDLTLHIVDDSSPTEKWLEEIEDFREDSRLHLYASDRNVGPYRIKNRIIAKTTSPFIAFQDADDVSDPERIGAQLEFMNRTAADIVGCGFSYIAGDGSVIARKPMVRNANFWMRLGKKFVALHATTIVRREVFEVLGGFDGTTYIAADTDFLLRAAHNFRIMNLKKCLYDYRLHDKSLSGAPDCGHGSAQRRSYISDMWQRERQRRRMKNKRDILLSLRARENDVEFALQTISFPVHKSDSSFDQIRLDGASDYRCPSVLP